MKVKSVGIVGYGHFGQFVETLARRFLPEVQVCVYSRRSEPDGQLFFSLEHTAQADVVVLCGAIGEYETQLESLLSCLGEETVVVDVATVKKHTGDIFKKHLNNQKYFCCHPMFGAESYKKTEGDISGYRIVVTDEQLGVGESQVVKSWLSGLGFDVIEMSADEHDKHLADTLFIAHYIGQVMHQARFDRTEIDTVSFASLMNAVESVKQDGKLFADVYKYNPYCAEAAERFHDAQDKVWNSLPKSS